MKRDVEVFFRISALGLWKKYSMFFVDFCVFNCIFLDLFFPYIYFGHIPIMRSYLFLEALHHN